MARPPLPVGVAGKISFKSFGPRNVRARCSVRDFDGLTREVVRFGPTQAAAERRLKEALRDRTAHPASGEITPDTRVRTLAKVWLAEMDGTDLAEQTREQYQRVLGKRIDPALGGLLLREVTVSTCDRFVKTVREHQGPSAARTARNVLSLVLGLAVRHGALATNPVREVQRMSRGKRSRPRALTVYEQIDLVKKLAADPEAARLALPDLAAFMLGTGVRVGEALAVRRTVVDLDAGVLEVNATAARIKGQGTVLQMRPKTEAGWRIIAIPDHVVELCRRRMDLAWPRNEHGLIFPSQLGNVWNPSNANREIRRALDRVDEDDVYGWVTSHTYRKTVATRLDEAGLSARAIADHLGHARPSMTQDVYMGRGVASAEAAKILDRS